MNSEMQLKVQAYLDNELTPGEARQIASLLTSDSEARDLYNELKSTKAIVAQNEPVLALPESRDFFWSKVQREITAAGAAARPVAQSPWWVRLLAPMAGAVALFAILLSISGTRPNDPAVNLASSTARDPADAVKTKTPNVHEGQVVVPEMSAITFRSDVEGVTVVWVSANQPQSNTPSWLDWFE